MKTDRFADIIRRKLDSIRPEFSERDWVRMQASLKQAGPSPNAPSSATHPFAGQAARLAVAGAVGTAIFLTTTIWQHYELKHLHQTLHEVTQKAVRPETITPDVASHTTEGNNPVKLGDKPFNQAGNQSVGGTQHEVGKQAPHDDATSSVSTNTSRIQHDTVYVNRYVAVPSAPETRLRTDAPLPANQQERHVANDRIAHSDFSTSPTRSDKSIRPQLTNRADNQPMLIDASDSKKRNNSIRIDKSIDQVASQPIKNQLKPVPSPDQVLVHETITNQSNRNRSELSGSGNNGNSTSKDVTTKNVTPATDNRFAQTQPVTPTVTPNTGAGEATQPETVYESIAALPMQTNTVHWNELLAQHAKRLRPTKTVMVNPQVAAAPASQPVRPMAPRFRIGAGTDINTNMWSNGAYSELTVGKHWSLSVGINRAVFSNKSFQTDFDFDQRMHEDFRKQYARAIDPRHDILNIQTHMVRVQVPINLSYRIPLNQTLTLLPSVGTNLNLQSQEFISFIYRVPFRGYNFVDDKLDHNVDLLNNMTLGTSIEWQRKHWVAQAGPVVTVPLLSDPSCQQTVSAGLRVRLFYQF